MTHVLYKKNDQWFKCYKDLGDGKYDDIMYIEISDMMADEYQRTDFTVEELLDLAKRGFGYVGMHGLKEHPEWVSTVNMKVEACS